MLAIVVLLPLFISSVVSLQNGLARTPPMGWMSWTKFFCQIDCVDYPNACINEMLYMSMADRMVDDGYFAAGYTSIHIDDCWLEKNRSSDGKLVADRDRFPSGMAALAKYMHDRGLKLAIYEDIGTQTCGGYPGSWGYEDIDAQTFADWGIDYLKYDGCNLDTSLFGVGFPKMRDALNKTGRPIVYSIEWDVQYLNLLDWDKVNYTQIAEISNLNRNYHDVSRSWFSILDIIDYFANNQDKFIPVNAPGFWNDPDMIIVGNYEITTDQAKVQMTMWSIWSAPLIMSNDLRDMAPGSREILTNKYVIAVDQDPLGIMGRMISRNGDISTYIKPMTPVYNTTYSYAIALLNRGIVAETPTFVLSDLGLNNAAGYNLMDLWMGKLLGTFKPNDTYFATVPATGVHFIKATALQ